MKNLLIFIHPSKDFDAEAKILVKVQIDNSLAWGWKPEDILLVTNFEYEYRGVKAIEVGDENYCTFNGRVSKVHAICTLYKLGLIQDELYWFHDLDAFQVGPINEAVTLGDADMGLTDYGRVTMWNTGSIFFKLTARDIFQQLEEVCLLHKTNEEDGLKILLRNKPELVSRVKKIDISFNFPPANIKRNHYSALKPIRVIHFHPLGTRRNGKPFNGVDFYIYGKNNLHRVLVTPQLKAIFLEHGIA